MAWDNTEPPQQSRAGKRVFEFSTRTGCERAMLYAAICLALNAVVLGMLGLTAYWGSPTGDATLDTRLDLMRHPWTLLNAVAYAVLGILVYRRNRAAATIAVIYFFVSVIMTSLVMERLALNIFQAIMLLLVVMAMVASFQWHRLYAAEVAQGTQSLQSLTGGESPAVGDSTLKVVLRFILGLYAGFFVIGVAGSIWALTEEPGLRSVVLLVTSGVEAFAAVNAFSAFKVSAAKAVKFATLLFVVGFIGGILYRLAFVVDSLGSTDAENLAFFATPLVLVLLRAWQESRSAAKA